MRKLQLLFISLVALSCSNDSDETEQIAETGFPFKVTVISSQSIDGTDTYTYFQNDLEKGAEDPSNPKNLNEELNLTNKFQGVKILNEYLSFQSNNLEETYLAIKNLNTNGIDKTIAISNTETVPDSNYTPSVTVGSKTIGFSYNSVENQWNLTSYDYKSNVIKSSAYTENQQGLGSSTLTISGKYLLYGYLDYDQRQDNGEPSKFIDIYEWSTLTILKTINVSGYLFFVADAPNLAMQKNGSFKIIDFTTNKTRYEGNNNLLIASDQFNLGTISSSKIRVNNRSTYGYIPGILNFSTGETTYFDIQNLIESLTDLPGPTNLDIIRSEVELQNEIAVITYQYYTTSDEYKYGVVFVDKNATVLANTELQNFPSFIYINK